MSLVQSCWRLHHWENSSSRRHSSVCVSVSHKSLFSASLCPPLSLDVSALPTLGPLLFISHASFFPSLLRLWIQTLPDRPMALCCTRPQQEEETDGYRDRKRLNIDLWMNVCGFITIIKTLNWCTCENLYHHSSKHFISCVPMSQFRSFLITRRPPDSEVLTSEQSVHKKKHYENGVNKLQEDSELLLKSKKEALFGFFII